MSFAIGDRVILSTADLPGLAHRVGGKTITGTCCGDGSNVKGPADSRTWVKVDDEFAHAFWQNPINMDNRELKLIDVITQIGDLDTCPTE